MLRRIMLTAEERAREIKRGVALRMAGKLREALEHFMLLQRNLPNDPEVGFYVAVTLDNLGRERQAIPRYHRVLQLDRQSPRTYEIQLYLASSYLNIGSHLAAACSLRRAVPPGGRKSALHKELEIKLESALKKRERIRRF